MCQTYRQCLRLVTLALFSLIMMTSSLGLSSSNETCTELSECEKLIKEYVMNQRFDEFSQLYREIKKNSSELFEDIELYLTYDIWSVDYKTATTKEKKELLQVYSNFSSHIESNSDFNKDTSERISWGFQSNIYAFEFSMKDTSTQIQLVKNRIEGTNGSTKYISNYLEISKENEHEFLTKLVQEIDWSQQQFIGLLSESIMLDSPTLYKLTRSKIGSIDYLSEVGNPICMIVDDIFPESDEVIDSEKIFKSKTMQLFFDSLSSEEKSTVCNGKTFLDLYFETTKKPIEVIENVSLELQIQEGYLNLKPMNKTFKGKNYFVTTYIQKSCNLASIQADIHQNINNSIVNIDRDNFITKRDQKFYLSRSLSETCHIQISIQKP